MTKEQPDPRHGHVELFNEYEFEIPLWNQNGYLGHDPEALRRDLGISRALLDDLRQWQRYWQTESGWLWNFDGSEQDRQHQARGAALRERLQQEVGHDIPVRLFDPSRGPIDWTAFFPDPVTRPFMRFRSLFSRRRAG